MEKAIIKLYDTNNNLIGQRRIKIIRQEDKFLMPSCRVEFPPVKRSLTLKAGIITHKDFGDMLLEATLNTNAYFGKNASPVLTFKKQEIDIKKYPKTIHLEEL